MSTINDKGQGLAEWLAFVYDGHKDDKYHAWDKYKDRAELVRELVARSEVLEWCAEHIHIEMWKDVKMAMVGKVAYPFHDLPEVLKQMLEQKEPI